MSLSDTVAQNEAELLSLRNKCESLEKSHKLLIQQNEQLVIALDKMRIERDTANRRASDVLTIISGVGEFALEGVKRMRGEEDERKEVRDQFTRLPQVNFS